MSRFLNFMGFQLGWLGCVVGAARGRPWLGPALAAALLIAHVTAAPNRAREVRWILLAGLLGFAVDTLQASAGFFSFTRTSALPWLSPPWMVALWMLFAATLNGCMSWLGGRLVLAAVLGALFGPLSYAAGARLGAIELPGRWIAGLAGVAAVWALAMPVLLVLRDLSIRAPADSALARRADRRGRRLLGGSRASAAKGRRNRPSCRAGRSFLAGALLLAAASIEPAAARELEGVRFAELHRSADFTMRLHCVALLRYAVFVKAYVAALYLGDRIDPADVLGDVPKRLEISYFWSIRGTELGEAGEEILARNVDPQTLAKLRSRLDRLNALYEDVEPGDRYSLTYVPGVGTELALNGRRLGVVDGADFAAAYFRIWLGDRPLDATLRERLLDCAEGRRGRGLGS